MALSVPRQFRLYLTQAILQTQKICIITKKYMSQLLTMKFIFVSIFIQKSNYG